MPLRKSCAYEISDHADVFVGSQELVPATGWDYRQFLQSLAVNPSMNASMLGTQIVGNYAAMSEYGGVGFETLSAIDLSALRLTNPGSLPSALDNFGSAVLGATTDDWNILGNYRNRYSNRFGDYRGLSGDEYFPNFLDIGNLFGAIATDGLLSSTIRSAAEAVYRAGMDAIIANYSNEPGWATGLSIYFSPGRTTPQTGYDAASLEFAADTQWDEFLAWW